MTQRWTWRITRADASTVANSRHAFAKVLRDDGRSQADIDTAVMIFGELIANACEHGRIPVDIQLRPQGDSLVLEVVDSGHDIARPRRRDPESLRGRGFEIIERLGGVINILPRPRSHVSVILPL
jgi:anti-sigma regulatory factor (Ser/Thr protein kinase)